MQDELRSLEELQAVDLENLEIRKQLDAIPKELDGMRTDVKNLGDILARERARLAEAEEWRADREKDVALQNELLAKSKAKLQSARNEKEQNAAQREIDTIRKSISEREDETIQVLEAMEQYRTAIDEHSQEFAELEKHLAEREEESRVRMAEFETAIGSTDGKRRELASRVPDRTLRLYERIHKRMGRAVVEAENGSCTGCYMALPPQLYNEVMRGDRIYQCPNCNRIVTYKRPQPEGEEAAENQ